MRFSFLVVPLVLACREGSLDPNSDPGRLYGSDDSDGDDDAVGEDDDADEGGGAFFPSSACVMPETRSGDEDDAAEVPEGDVARPNYVKSSGFFVRDGRLYDKYGNDFVMRGVNNAHAWFDTGGRNLAIGALDDIAGYGFNAVRVVWETEERNPGLTVKLLRQVLDCVVANEMVPMLELHDVTGVPQGLLRHIESGELVDWQTVRDAGDPWEDYEELPADEANALANERLLDMAKYYAREDVKEVLLAYEDTLLLNIANEWSGEDFYGGYSEAIAYLRDHGLHHTLVIDANGWGQNADVLLQEGARLLEADVEHNLLFSTHMYEAFAENAHVTEVLEAATAAKLPFIVGEFGPEHSGKSIDVDFIFAESARLETGFLSWSWKGNGGELSVLDMAKDWEGEELTAWGQAIVDSPHGSKTAERASVFLF